ncbi:MAG TPA: hypothetical protein VD789_07580, partial [Thermomicrobiales bacterium]|nr:hypothetical protein [Thermomicrobiales bacterium]
TDLAVRDLEGRRESLVGSVRRLLVSIFGRSSDHHLPEAVARRQRPTLRSVPGMGHPPRSAVRPVAPVTANGGSDAAVKRWQRHPQLRVSQSAPPTHGSRSARLEAERGMILARGGKLAEAEVAFTTAASDANIDLSELPGFWDLPRNAMMTAVRAYERVDRLRDAATLEARMRHMLRPRALKLARPAARQDRLTASGD